MKLNDVLSNSTSQDPIARWGGEQFILHLPETGRCSGRLVAEKIRRRIADTPFFVTLQQHSICP